MQDSMLICLEAASARLGRASLRPLSGDLGFYFVLLAVLLAD